MGWCWAIVGQSWDNHWLILTKKKLDKVGKDYETRSQSYELRFNMIQQNRTCHQWYPPRNILLFIYVWVPKMIRSTRNSWSFCPSLGGINLYEGPGSPSRMIRCHAEVAVANPNLDLGWSKSISMMYARLPGHGRCAKIEAISPIIKIHSLDLHVLPVQSKHVFCRKWLVTRQVISHIFEEIVDL